MPQYPLSDWRAEQFRLTVFPMPGATARASEWWEAVMASPPDETTSNPKKGTTKVVGILEPGQLVLQLQPARIDWLFVLGDLDSTVPLQEPPNLGPVTEAVRTFSDVAERWLGRNDTPEIARIAFGAILYREEPDRRSAYVRLPDYVPVRVDPDSSDFLFQINLPIDSRAGVDGIRINRLSKWSVASYNIVTLRVAGHGVIPEGIPQPLYALRLELDINTMPEFQGPIPGGQLIAVYRELVELGLGITATGLVPQ